MVADRGGALQVHAGFEVEIALGQRGDRRRPVDPGVVDDDVEPAEGRHRLFDDRRRARPVGDAGKVTAFLDLLAPFGILELARTGTLALKR